MHLLIFSLSWIVILYLFNALLACKFQRVKLGKLLLYIFILIAIGMLGEVFVGTMYHALTGSPLWEYRIFPIHNAYTSYYSIVIWGMYGFYLYFFHDNLAKLHIKRGRYLAIILAVEALILEVLINITHILFFNEYIFYYFPADLWHLTSIQAFPFYLMAGLLIAKSTKHCMKKPIVYFVISLLIIFTLLIF